MFSVESSGFWAMNSSMASSAWSRACRLVSTRPARNSSVEALWSVSDATAAAM